MARLLEGEQIAPLCREFGITRPTGYRIWERYQNLGELALVEQNLIAQQESLDHFMKIYNYERPHQGINNKYPSEIYRKSKREFIKPEPLFYPFHDKTITVSHCGRICDRGLKVSLSKAFAGVEVGIKEMEDGIWVVSFLDYDLGYFDDKGKRVGPIEDPFGLYIKDGV